MYSPKLRKDLIRKLYFAAKARGMPMTRYLAEIVGEALVGESDPPPYEPSARRKTRRNTP